MLSDGWKCFGWQTKNSKWYRHTHFKKCNLIHKSPFIKRQIQEVFKERQKHRRKIRAFWGLIISWKQETPKFILVQRYFINAWREIKVLGRNENNRFWQRRTRNQIKQRYRREMKDRNVGRMPPSLPPVNLDIFYAELFVCRWFLTLSTQSRLTLLKRQFDFCYLSKVICVSLCRAFF